MSALVREALEVRKAQALSDLVDVERRVEAGELDRRAAAALAVEHEAEVLEALSGLAALGRPEDRDKRLVVGGVLAAALVAGLAFWGIRTADRSADPAGQVPTQIISGEGEVAGRDLSDVTNEEMEAVIAENPGVVPMRLALVERYLRAGELAPARDHAEAALGFDAGAEDRARALRYLGWTTALLGEPGEGAALLDQSLDLAPGNLDGLWFLANVRLQGLADPAGAVPLLERILANEIDQPQRERVQTLLTDSQAQLRATS